MNTIFDVLSFFFVASGIAIAIYILIDVYRNPQSMKIMNVVWVLTALWGSYLALWAYLKFGREKKCIEKPTMKMDNDSMDMSDMKDMDKMDMKGMDMGDTKSMDMSSTKNMSNMMPEMNMKQHSHWQSIALSALHCGAGCTLADILGEWFTYHYPITIGSSQLVGSWIFDFILALIIGVFFQFYAIREMEKISFFKGISRAFRVDFFSLTSWQVGMYGWMAIVYFIIFKDSTLSKSSPEFWFMMQIAMLLGFICAYPMNALLIKLGIKKGM